MIPEPSDRRLGVDGVVALVVTLLAIVFHVACFLFAGGLWRDEAVSTGVASLPTLSDVWEHLQCDSFPMLWPLVLRGWGTLGTFRSDVWLRALGMIVGLLLLGALWRHARLLGARVPIAGLGLLACNAAVVLYGDSVRGYGLGMLLALLTVGSIWKVVESPRGWTIVVAWATCLAAVHALFYNSIIVLASCAAGWVVCWRHGYWRRAAWILLIGASCALSLAPYAWTLGDVGDWVMIVRYDVDFAWIWTKFKQTVGLSGDFMRWIWMVAAAGGIVVALRGQRAGADHAIAPQARDIALYCATVLLVGIPAYLIFLRMLRYLMQPWYYLAFLVMIAACVEGCLAAIPSQRAKRVVLPIMMAAIIVATLPSVSRQVIRRKTSVDVIAAKLTEVAEPRDLVVVSPWTYAHTFNRYYHGTSRWTALPPVEVPHLDGDVGLLGLKREMMNRDAVAPVLSAIEATLRAGHRVYWVGRLRLPSPGEEVRPVDPAPFGPLKWDEGQYHRLWDLQAGAFLLSHAERRESLLLPGLRRVSHYEDAVLTVIQGWKG